jgi:hypothetical protein
MTDFDLSAIRRSLLSGDGQGRRLDRRRQQLDLGNAARNRRVRGVVDQVVSANKELADMQSMAERVGVSFKDLQGIKFGAAIAGLSDSDINSDLEKSASLLNDAQRNANTLSKAFEANGLSIRNSNGQLITENQLLQNAADLVRRAQTPQDQIAIAQMLGFTKEWVPLLEQGARAIAGLGEEARQAGAVIDDETVKRAADFDAEWRKSSVAFEANMKAALSGLLPIIDDLIDQASKFIGSFDSKAIQQAADENLKQFRDATGVPDSGGIHIDTDNLSRALQVWQDSPIFSLETWREFGRAFSSSIQLLSPEDLKWLQGSGSAISDTSPQALLAGASTQNFWGTQLAALQGMSGDLSGVGGFTKIPGRNDDSKDAVDRAIDSLRKHTEQQLADAQAVGLGDAALARFRATAAETAAVQANGGEEDDVAIATQLKGIYGSDVPAALASSEASALRLNTAFRGLSSSIENDMVNGLTDILSGAKSASQGFADLEAAVVKAIEQMIIKITIVELLMRALQSTFSGFSGVRGAWREWYTACRQRLGACLLGGSVGSIRKGRRARHRREPDHRADGAVRRGWSGGDHAAAPRLRRQIGCRGGWRGRRGECDCQCAERAGRSSIAGLACGFERQCQRRCHPEKARQ